MQKLPKNASTARVTIKKMSAVKGLITCVQNSLSTNRPSFVAANQVTTLTRLTNERVV